MATFVTNKPVRISFPVLWSPKPDLNGKDRYTCEFLIDKNDTDLVQAFRNAIQEAATEKFGSKMPKMLRTPIHDGDGTKPQGNDWPEEYHGYWVVRASANVDHAPLLRDRFGNNLREDAQGAGKVYGGDLAYAVLTLFGFDSQGNKGVGCGIQQVMVTNKGEAFGGDRVDESALDMFVEKDDSNPFASFM